MKSFLKKEWGWLKPKLKACAFWVAEMLLADAQNACKAARTSL